jgi:hypothetical protein
MATATTKGLFGAITRNLHPTAQAGKSFSGIHAHTRHDVVLSMLVALGALLIVTVVLGAVMHESMYKEMTPAQRRKTEASKKMFYALFALLVLGAAVGAVGVSAWLPVGSGQTVSMHARKFMSRSKPK